MKTIILDGREMTGKEEFHRIVAREFCFPDWYGNNLDALFDCLMEVCEDTQITFRCLGDMQASLGSYTQDILSTFFDAQEENDYLAVALLGEEEDD